MLNGKIAVITGASSGIGKALAQKLAKEGMLIYLLGRDKKKLNDTAKQVKKAGSQAKVFAFDLTNANEVRKFAHKYMQSFKVLDILVHSAGAVKLDYIENAKVKDFDKQYKINLRAPFLLTQALINPLKNTHGHVIFINSGAGLRANANWSQYAATKHGLKALADSLRLELKDDKVKVTTIYPGRTAGKMQENVRQMENANYKASDYIQVDDLVDITIDAIRNPQKSADNIKVGKDGVEDYRF